MFLGIIAITIVLQVVMVEFLKKFANTERLNWGQWGLCIGIGIVSWPIGCIVKWIPVPKRPFLSYLSMKKMQGLPNPFSLILKTSPRLPSVWLLVIMYCSQLTKSLSRWFFYFYFLGRLWVICHLFVYDVLYLVSIWWCISIQIYGEFDIYKGMFECNLKLKIKRNLVLRKASNSDNKTST